MQRPSPDELDRVVVVGTSCSGKTTFARQLSELLRARHIELDAIHWKADWEPRAPAELRRLVEEAVSVERWIADGNYSVIREVIWPRATAVAWLNYPFWRVFSRALWRTVRRAATGEELYSGNRETFRKAFLSRDSILLWIITSHWRQKREYRRLQETGTYPRARFIEFRRPAQATLFLSQLGAENPAGARWEEEAGDGGDDGSV
jgi:adenylate kinase family enzyme